MGANKTGEDVNGFITEPPHPPATPSPPTSSTRPLFSRARWHSDNLAVSLTIQLQTSGTQVLRELRIGEVGTFSLNIFSIHSCSQRTSLSLSRCLSLSLSIAFSLFATETAVVILRGSCVNSVFSWAVNDNSALPVSPSAQADTHSPLLSSLNYLPLIQIRKLKSRSSVKALCWVMRERPMSVCLHVCVCARVWTHECVYVCGCTRSACRTESYQSHPRPRFQRSLSIWGQEE